MKITAESHVDHGLTPEHLAWILERCAAQTAFFITTLELPSHLPPLMCGLHGPATGDEPIPDSECHREVRGERPGPSRLCGRPPKPTRLVTIVAGPDGEEPCVLYTAYGGPQAPREPWDPGLDDEGRVEAESFWSRHALSEGT